MNANPSSLTLAEIAGRLDTAGIPWALFAGAAAGIYGAARPVTDVDILLPAGSGARLAALFPEAEVERDAGGAVEIVRLANCDLVPGWADIDLDERMAARRTWHTLAGLRVPVVPVEDNILWKARMGRGPEAGKHDWEDVAAMLRAHPALDWDYLLARAAAFGQDARTAHALERLRRMTG